MTESCSEIPRIGYSRSTSGDISQVASYNEDIMADSSQPIDPSAKLPVIKFYKDAVADILTGRKTLEPRPRSATWIRRLEQAGYAALSYGPRYGAPIVFARVRITDVTLRPFDSATNADLARIGGPWPECPLEQFIDEYQRWFVKELAKGYPVAWISFQVIGQ